jgi:hypothetical protein
VTLGVLIVVERDMIDVLVERRKRGKVPRFYMLYYTTYGYQVSLVFVDFLDAGSTPLLHENTVLYNYIGLI